MSWALFWKTVLMGLIEGITEFLPISSTGHMILADEFIQLTDNHAFTAAFTVFIQSGAVLAVVILFRKELWPFSGERSEKHFKWLIWAKMLTGMFPAAVLGILFHEFIEKNLFNPVTVAIALCFYGILLVLFEHHHKTRTNALQSIRDISFKTALLIGLFQCLALIPGTSRSTATILGGMLLGLNRTLAAEFSFFLSVPTIAAAGLLQLIQTDIAFSAIEWSMLAIGFITSFLTASAAIYWLMKFLRRHSFMAFGWYRIVLGATVLCWWFLK